jgi:hypothetical protein
VKGLIATRAVVDEVRKSCVFRYLEPTLKAREYDLLFPQGAASSIGSMWHCRALLGDGQRLGVDGNC